MCYDKGGHASARWPRVAPITTAPTNLPLVVTIGSTSDQHPLHCPTCCPDCGR